MDKFSRCLIDIIFVTCLTQTHMTDEHANGIAVEHINNPISLPHSADAPIPMHLARNSLPCLSGSSRNF